jgi:hypothetical protein
MQMRSIALNENKEEPVVAANANEVPPVEQARKLLEQVEREQLETCQRELAAVLQRYGCVLAAQVAVTPDGRIVANVAVTKSVN